MLKMYRNLKIQKKLLFGFGMVVVLTFALTSVNLLTMRNIDTTYSNLLDNPVQGLQITQTMQREYVEARRFLLSAAFNADDAEAFNTAINSFYSTVQKIKSLSDTLIASVQKDPDISAEERSGAIAAVQQTTTRITVDFNNLGKELETAVKQENATTDEVRAIAAAGGKITKEISDELDDFAGLIQSKMQESSDNASKHINFMVLLLSIISIIVYLIAIIIAVGIGKTIRGPIVHLTEAAKKIAGGSLDTPVRMNETDEIGALSNMIGDMVDIFSLLVERINLSYSLLMKGELDVAIDEKVFPGGYKDAASAVNTMVNYLAGNTFLAIQCINEYGKGNFDASMKRFTGPQAVLHESLDGLQSNLKAVNRDIGKLIEKTVIGELDLRIDSKVYEGDWKRMAQGLNKLMDAVETPISEVSGVLERVAKADFSANIKGDYKGKFDIMKIAVNKTVQNTAEYIQDISGILDRMSHQDLDIYITKNYIGDFAAIKDALNQILVAFNGVIGDFSLSAEQVASGANQISESSMTLSQGATEQASTLEELTATIEAIANQTAENSRNTERANSLSSDTKTSGLVGNDEMKEMLKSMSDMEEASMSISKIISVIDGIAFQTNLLALNAAVEAARAGQHGKGFAVVAEEVRSLAGRSQKAASETTELINKTVDIVSNGTKIANRTADSLHKMVEEIAQISILIDGVSTASKRQNAAIQQINEGIRQISEVTQANTATSEESASSAQELFSQAEMLKNTVSKFKLRR